LRKSGALNLCIWDAIKFASTKVNRFDFEGSMVETIEISFRAFGAEQVPYFKITKYNNRLLKSFHALREIFII